MIRSLVGLLGLLAALFPAAMVDVFESLAVENADDCPTKPWISSAIRAEGIVVALASLIGGRPYVWMLNLTGIFGAVVLVVPDLYRSVATGLLYTDPTRVQWNRRFTQGVRLIGLAYVLLAISAATGRRHSE